MKSLLPLAFLLITSFVQSAENEVIIKKFKFRPAEITVQQGESILWLNKERIQYHSVWFEKSGEEEPDIFFPKESYQRTFNDIGDFSYRCGPHPKMLGIVHVVAKKAPDKTNVVAKGLTVEKQTQLIHLLKNDCGSCHGYTLKGGLGPALLPKALKGKTISYLQTTILKGRVNTAMPPWEALLTEQEAQFLAETIKAGLAE